MKASFILFALTNLALLGLTAVMGLQVEGRTGYARHVMLGVLSGLFTCFVHVVYYMYFVVQEKIMAQSILHHGLAPSHGERVRRMKSAAFRWSMGGVLTILLVSGLGAGIEAGVSPRVHMAAGFLAMFIEAGVFFGQFVLLDDYQGVFKAAFDEE